MQEERRDFLPSWRKGFAVKGGGEKKNLHFFRKGEKGEKSQPSSQLGIGEAGNADQVERKGCCLFSVRMKRGKGESLKERTGENKGYEGIKGGKGGSPLICAIPEKERGRGAYPLNFMGERRGGIV